MSVVISIRRCARMTLGLVLLSVTWSAFGQPITPNEMRGILSAQDEQFLSGFALHMTVSRPYPEPQPGRFTSHLQLSGNPLEQYLISIGDQSDDPIYVRTGQPIDYDIQGNMIVWRPRDSYIVLDHGRGTLRTDQDCIRVSQQGKVVSSTKGAPCIEIYPPGNGDPTNMLFRYVLALGRGYSPLISGIDSVGAPRNGMVSVTGRGSLFSPCPGKWLLEVDKTKQYLVRRAVFTQDGAHEPALICETQGDYPSTLVLAKDGSFGMSGFKVTVSLTDYKREFDEAVRKEVLSKVSTSGLRNAVVVDHTRLNSAGSPLVTDIHEDRPPQGQR